MQERLTVIRPEQAQQILDELAGRMAIAQVQNPIRYCATLLERLQRGKFLPELGLKVADARRAEDARRIASEQIEKSATRSGPFELPVKFREQIRRLRSKARA